MTVVEAPHAEAVGRFAMLASAITSRRVAVLAIDDSATYTDGRTIYVNAEAPRTDVRDAVAIQAALLAGGSLARDILLQLSRRRGTVTRRYLSLEVARLAGDLKDALPPATVARALREVPVAAATDSRHSLKRALGAAAVPAPPPWVGTLKVIPLLRAGVLPAGTAPTSDDLERDGDSADADAVDDDSGDEPSKIRSLFASPLSNPLSDAIRNVFGTRASDNADVGGGGELRVAGRRSTPTGPKAMKTRFARAIATIVQPAPTDGIRYPEWDDGKNVYRPDWCAVAEYDPLDPGGLAAPARVAGSLYRPLARVGVEAQRHRRQHDGDALDLGALVDYIASRRRGERPDATIYEQARMTKRDLSVLILLDATGSTNEASDGGSIFEEERRLTGELTASLDSLGDHVATYGFYSSGRNAVRFLRIKGFADRFDTAARRRLFTIAPTGFTRLGAALRHGAHLLQSQARATNMVLVVIGDGLPYDDGYEDNYARADTRQAISEAVLSGIGVVGLAIRSSVEAQIHEDIWFQAPFRVVKDVEDARKYLRPLLLDALRITRGNGRRRELSSATGHADLRSWMAKGRRLNSYV